MKTQYSQILLVDGGGFFPEQDTHRDVAWFLMDAMHVLNVDAVGIGDRDLRFGLAFLRDQAKRSQLPLTSANLFDKKTKKTAVAPYIFKKVGTVKVGLFSLISDKVDLGPARDSMLVQDPPAAAKRTVEELRKKGATVIVLLSQLGKVESEDLVTAVDGIDAVVVGRNSPMLQKGRLIKTTVACYGGEQGQYIGRTVFTLDPARKATGGDNEVFILGPEVGEKPEIAQIVKAFEDGFNEKLRKAEREKQTEAAARDMERNPDKYLGSEVCIRCHAEQAEQWKSTPHARAWQTLVDNHKDTANECVECHVLGFKKPGGFQTGTQTPSMANVQCESCHGMGTQHEAFAATPQKVTEAVCTKCHNKDNDPSWDFSSKLAKVAH
jgi:2',3'-cyclic-nucleotide 2'-phosphodiesterase (5'-nucleotidase family)